jgi:protein-disulfide isomerase
MIKLPRRLLVLAALAIGLAVQAPARAAALVTADEMGMGDPHARVTVVEYGSASCPHCAHFNNDIFPAFKAKYIDTGRVHYVFREFITPPENLAIASFLLARCAGADKYFSVLDAIFHAQAKIYASGDAATIIYGIAQDAGLSKAAADACLADKDALKAMQVRVTRFAQVDKINATPTFVVNGQRLEGTQTLDQLSAAVEQAEAKAKR